MKLAWTSDLHLVLLRPTSVMPDNGLATWLEQLARQPFDALAISGDISEAPHLHQHLEMLEAYVQCPIYFVLGNHDFYWSSIGEVLPALRSFTSSSALLHCLDLMEHIEITPTTSLIGHGCWGDGGYGDFFGSRIMLNDWKVIEELAVGRRVHGGFPA